MKKRYAAFLLALLLLALCACGAASGGSDAENRQSAYSVPAEEAPEIEYAAEMEATSDSAGAAVMLPGVTQPSDSADKMIYNAEAEVETMDYETAVESVDGLIEELDGFIESSSVGGMGYGSTGARYAEFVIRIPAEVFSEVDSALRSLGNVAYYRAEAQNVTSEYIDVQSRLEAYRLQEERLLALLEEAGSLEDMLTLESYLTDVRYNIESYTTHLNRLDSQINYSTLTLYLREVVEYSPDNSVQRSLGSRVSDAFSGSISALGSTFEAILLGAVYFWYVIVIIIVVLAVWRIRRRRRKARRAAENAENNP